PGEPGSTFTNIATDGTPVQITTPGEYIIGISGVGSMPTSGGGAIYDILDPIEVSGPDGPGGASPHTGWDADGAFGSYTIRIFGAEFIPAPAAIAPLGVWLGAGRRRRI
ncbi:MAG: hypothetical protein KDA28_05285, partial [Phycisphaerales bacterium]|nr:hypothetical protein [Phycisphaerales bacterium]